MFQYSTQSAFSFLFYLFIYSYIKITKNFKIKKIENKET